MLQQADVVPAPEPPDSPDAWYAPDMRSQYEVHPGTVVTVLESGDGFVYDARRPVLGASDGRSPGVPWRGRGDAPPQDRERDGTPESAGRDARDDAGRNGDVHTSNPTELTVRPA